MRTDTDGGEFASARRRVSDKQHTHRNTADGDIDGRVAGKSALNPEVALIRKSDRLTAGDRDIQHDDRITDVGFSRDGLLVWSRSNRELRIWETATGDSASALRHRGPPPPTPKSPRGGPLDDDEVVSTAWSSAARVASCDSRGCVDVWDFSIGSRPLAEMETLSRVLSMHRIEPGGGLVPLSREELRAAWAAHRR